MQTNPSNNKPALQTLSRDSFWRRHVDQWRTSGLSKMAYCKEYSLVYHQMVYWCSKPENADEQQSHKNTSSDFVPVSVSPLPLSAGLCVRLPNGIAIEGIDENNVGCVSQLVKQL